ncbi:MAG: hypothetical protein ACW98K_02275 [Candidatus Kariarchaeaceae archaeon]|jgi:uncharacterized protein YbaR (Trm112 family)
MQRRLLDVLADPDNPDYWPLELKIIKSEMRDREVNPHPHENGLLCKFYCNTKNKYLVNNPLDDDETQKKKDELAAIVSLDECYECIKEEIIDGIVFHNKEESTKWFIIDREIPVMFPLELRDNDQEKKFIAKYKQECNDFGINKPYTD